ncbi:hypothetical protein [Sphingomonas sp.]|uniref:hypothetical protein n=1 Tax=Sphingomonas sp. TaxID=28214 RepID=UPI003B3B8924
MRLRQTAPPNAVAIAKRILKFRRKREALLGAGLFADPAWDMLLDLLVAEEAGQTVSISSLCIASAVPATTALRWIKALEQVGYVAVRPNPIDGRGRTVRLLPLASTALRSLLGDLERQA